MNNTSKHLDELISLCRHPKIQGRRGEWGSFMQVQQRQLYEADNPNGMKKSEWVNWLLDPIRFCELVAEWWKEWRTK